MIQVYNSLLLMTVSVDIDGSDTLNKALEKKFGKNAKIVANLFTDSEKTKHTFTFHLGKGTDLFSTDGSLQHD